MTDNSKRIAVGCDHAAYDLKMTIVEKLASDGYEVVDVGTHSEESCDYPVFAHKVGEKVAGGECARGILVCGSGVGMSMAANKVKGIRAIVCTEPYSAYLSRLHNDSNVLCLGARIIGSGMAMEIVRRWLKTEFEGGRHETR